jgi:hypothetical protein
MTQDKKTEAREWWISETWLLGDPEMKNYFVETREPSAQFRNGAIQNYYRAIEYSAVEQLQAKLDEAVKALEDIYRKSPQKVSREEAADMACEFYVEASEALQKIRGQK